MEKDAHKRAVDELQKVKEYVAELEAKLRIYEVGAGFAGKQVKRLGMFDDQVEQIEEPIEEGSGEVEGNGVGGLGCANVGLGVEAQTTTLPQPAPLQRQEEEEGKGKTVGNEGGTHELSSNDDGSYIREMREAVQVSASASSNVTPLREVKHGGRRPSNVGTRVKSKPRTRKALVLQVSPYTNPLHRRMGLQRVRRRETVMLSKGAHCGIQLGRKVRSVKDVVSGGGPPLTAAAVTQMNPIQVRVMLEKQML